MKISVIGTGYVGLASACCLAELGHDVAGVDIDEKKIAMLKQGKSPIFEPGLEELLVRNLKSGRLSFTTDIEDALPGCQVLFCAVATPPNEDYTADLRAVFAVCESVARHTETDIVFVNKSTVPVGTGKECEERMGKVLKERGVKIHLPVISNPEFLREGTAVQDTLHPDRIIVGINGDTRARDAMEELYLPLTRIQHPIVFLSRESAEIVKYASNAFLAAKISFINMLSELCEKTGGNIRDVAKGMGLDDRIGTQFLHAGIGYGGSCFPKDVKALLAIGRKYHVPVPLIEATHAINDRQRQRFFAQLLDVLPKKATVGVWGLSFKPNTDDLREAPSVDLVRLLLKSGHRVRAFDPVAMDNARRTYPAGIDYVSSPLEAAEGVDAVILLTEWDVFRGIDLRETKKIMKGNDLFDGRNMYDPAEVEAAGLKYHGIGIGIGD
ncbi:MAG: UDP-glucose/GDP-mannose dehydrogenase family protein [Candidatus Peribacteraceae bacterium]|nr:UDP-glucose/GDP-mannose dehydrogenase family protein [Candidatus Peribacteraceae bacterium]